MAEETEKDEVLLDVNGLCVTLFTEDGALPAIKDLSFKMRRGETFAVVGESGCGKSMMALSIMGLIPQPPAKIVAGSIEFDGTDLTKLSRDQLRDYRGNKISMIFQEPMIASRSASASSSVPWTMSTPATANRWPPSRSRTSTSTCR